MEKIMIQPSFILKMNEFNSIETLTNTYSNMNAIPLSDKTKLRLNEINKIKD